MVKRKNNVPSTEKEYRQLDVLSYSALKKYNENIYAFYKEFVLKEPRREKSSESMILGSLVHTLLAGQDFHEKFHLFEAIAPVGQMKTLAEAVYDRYMISVSDEGVQQDSFETVFSDAFNKVKYDYNGTEIAFKGKTMDKVFALFENSDAEFYFKELVNCHGKDVVTLGTVDRAEKLVNKLSNHDYTMERTFHSSTKEYERFNEVPIVFEIKGIPFKAMPDRLEVDHINKEIFIFDWKTSWMADSEDGVTYDYLKRGYYIQAGLYYYAVRQWANEKGWKKYKIHPMQFIFIDSTGVVDPVILKLSQKDIAASFRGFELNGRYYAGIDEIIENLAWNVENQIWTTTRDLKAKNGVVELSLNYK